MTEITFTLPAGHKWTTVEAALREAHDQEYEMRMYFFFQCERLKEQVERLTKAGDEVIREWSMGDETDALNFMKALVIWNAAKEGKDREAQP